MYNVYEPIVGIGRQRNDGVKQNRLGRLSNVTTLILGVVRVQIPFIKNYDVLLLSGQCFQNSTDCFLHLRVAVNPPLNSLREETDRILFHVTQDE